MDSKECQMLLETVGLYNETNGYEIPSINHNQRFTSDECKSRFNDSMSKKTTDLFTHDLPFSKLNQDQK